MVTNIIDQLLTKMLLGKRIKWPSYKMQEIPRKMKSVVKLLHDFLVAILDRVPENDRIVILGRDLWPIFPKSFKENPSQLPSMGKAIL